MKQLFLSLFLFIALAANAQYFQDASANLPDVGSQFQSMDVRAADLDGDGDLDIVLANEFQANTILTNDGNGQFSNNTLESLPQEIHDSEDVAIADYDQDGDPDLLFCSEDDITQGWLNVHEFYLNDGNGQFTESSTYQFPDSKANAVIAADLNDDDWPDVLFGNDGQNTLFINDQSGGFTDETSTRLPANSNTTQDLALEDIDDDGDLDLFVGNEDGNKLLINDGTGTFTDETTSRLPQGVNMETRKATFGDVDLDGDPDLFLANVEFIPGKNRQNRLYLNDGTGTFTDETATRLPPELELTLDGIFLDVDFDGDPDLITCGISVANSAIAPAPVDAYFNDGTGIFSKDSEMILGGNYPVKGLGLIAADLNGDGHSDLYVCDRKDNNDPTKDLLLLGDVTISIENVIPKDEGVKLFPNPGDSVLTLRFDKSVEKAVFRLYDASGQLVARPQVDRQSDNTIVLRFPNVRLPKGNYWLQIDSIEDHWLVPWQVVGQ